MRRKSDRSIWKQILATTAVALSMAPTCSAHDQGRIVESIMERFETDIEGQMPKSQRANMHRQREQTIGRNDSRQEMVNTTASKNLQSPDKVDQRSDFVDASPSTPVMQDPPRSNSGRLSCPRHSSPALRDQLRKK